MVEHFLLALTLAFGQTQPSASAQPTESCPCPATREGGCCEVDWLRPWTTEDLEMKPSEPAPICCGWDRFFWCPEKQKDDDQTIEQKSKQDAEQTNGKESKQDAPPKPDTPLMQAMQCRCPAIYERLRDRGVKCYGWVWMGFTGNFDSPKDRINFGTNYNWRSNDFRLDQVYFICEKPLKHEDEANLGYRVDFYGGHQAPFMVSNGLFSSFTGFDPTSGYGAEGPASFRQLNRIGLDLPQFYLNAHLPSLLTGKGVDLLAGKFWTLIGHEVYQGPQTEFYSHSYEIVYGTPFDHTGTLATLHATDTWDITAGTVVGSDVFEDNNDRWSYTGNFVWNSCDKRWNWTTAWITGPEQFNNNDNYRTVVTSYVTVNFGSHNQWRFISGGICAHEANAATAPVTGDMQDAEWYGLSNYLFYTVSPKLILGSRGEWFRDDDGTRTAVTKRPGFAANFFEVTLGVTYKPYQNLRLRPEFRVDWSDGPAVDGSAPRPFNDLRDSAQLTSAIDAIWEF
jgi:hypothetical protein